ncbi:hypothetical protein GGI12_003096, partial [Dipsacomyces acuminosporus]
MLAKIFAPSLQTLWIVNMSPDITWNWFDGDDDDTKDVCFSNLQRLVIEFSLTHMSRASYHDFNLSNVHRLHSFQSLYRNISKRVQFPKLEELK